MEKEEIRLMPEVEEEEMALQYETKGVDPRTARRMAEEVMRDPVRALGEQVQQELKIGGGFRRDATLAIEGHDISRHM